MEICASSLTAWTLTSKKVWQRSWTEPHLKSLRSWRTFALATLSNLTHGHFAQHTWILPMHTFQDPQIGAFSSCKSSLVIQNEVLCGLLWADTSLHGNLQEATLPCKCLTLTTRDASTCFQVCEHLAAAWTGMTHTFSRVSYWEFVRFLSPPLYRNHACSTTKTRYMETWQSCSFSKHWAVALVSFTLISVRAEFGTAVWEFTRLIAFSVHKEITLKKCQSSCKKMIVLFKEFLHYPR